MGQKKSNCSLIKLEGASAEPSRSLLGGKGAPFIDSVSRWSTTGPTIVEEIQGGLLTSCTIVLAWNLT